MHEQILPDEEVKSNSLEAAQRPYMGANLRANPHANVGLVKRLQAASAVSSSTTPCERCGLVFVRKKSGKQR
eukprot:1544328-Pyramimonas_sp.AAC.1